MGFWVNGGGAMPRQSLTAWAKSSPRQFWGASVRERIASQLAAIRHWTIFHADYTEIPLLELGNFTAFIDPPYQIRGHRTKGVHKGAHMYPKWQVDYPKLADDARSYAQSIVCEGEGADWLPFTAFAQARAMPIRGERNRISPELVWCS